MNISIVFTAFFIITFVNADTFTLTGLVRDFWPCSRMDQCGQQTQTPFSCRNVQCHPDFENYNGNDRGIPQTLIKLPDRVPLFNSSTYHPSIKSASSFAQWYKDVPGTNIPMALNITFDNTICPYPPCDSRVYIYNTSLFFPIDYQGFGNYENSRNYHFTFEMKTRFAYRGGEIFQYRGDDDLWVFINDKLVVDLGGVHNAQDATIELDKLNLIKGQNYPIDIFFAERHTFSSKFRVYTSLELYCPWRDHCGVCQGNGQSCCDYCDDKDECTKDKCDIMNGICNYIPLSCIPSNLCLSSHCFQGSCIESPINCDDGNECTEDSCNKENGCINKNIICDDNNECTIDSCDAKLGCQYKPINCNSSDFCKIDNCDPLIGCISIDKICNDNDPCTIDKCSSENKKCEYEEIECDRCEGIICRIEDQCKPNQCNPNTGKCQSYDISCDDKNPCTIDECKVINGKAICNQTLINCKSEDPCFLSKCDINTGLCVNSPIICSDGNQCTEDKCINGKCEYKQIICEDNNKCTKDRCSSTEGCLFEKITCDDNNLCTNDTCFPDIGCSFKPIEIMVTDKCTNSFCDPLLGIISNAVECRPKDKCKCDPEEGCKCDDNLPIQAIVFLSSGIIAVIVVASVVGAGAAIFGGRKGYQYWKSGRETQMTSVVDNPLYKSAGSTVENRLYEPPAV